MKEEKDIAKAIIGLLDESASKLGKNTADKLAAARQRALQVHAQKARTASGYNGGSSVASLFADYVFSHRGVSSAVLACSAVFVAFVVTQQLNNNEVDGQGDAFLLASELPPEAYLDKGFHTWVEQTSQQ